MVKFVKIIYLVTILFSSHIFADEKVIRIYQDADLSNHNESSDAIQKGIEVAFGEIDNEIDDYKVEFKYLDHRGNVIRSKRNYQTFLNDPNGVAIYSGIHSPPLIKNRTFINESKALTLVPWAAGGPITRYPSKENWIFRLSVDDMRAGNVIIDFALKTQQCKKPHLLLEQSPWGDSNFVSMSKALKSNNIERFATTRFNWNIKSQGARTILREINAEGSDCIVLVSNAVEGVVIVGELAKLPAQQRLPVVSHWGITGGNFHEKIPAEVREQLNLHFIQSCFAFTNPKQSKFALSVFDRLRNITSNNISEPQDLKSAVGFIHAYDLTRLLIQAINEVGLTGNMDTDRDAIRLALENIEGPIEGLVKTYQNPFSEFNEKSNLHAHEALHQENYCMGKYGSNDEILISQ